MDIQQTKPIEIEALTEAMKRAVPSVTGLSDHGMILVVHGVSLTSAEVIILDGVYASHDAVKIQQDRHAAQVALETERKKDPAALSILERLHRIEMILHLEKGG
jgi:hypothetical protein